MWQCNTFWQEECSQLTAYSMILLSFSCFNANQLKWVTCWGIQNDKTGSHILDFSLKTMPALRDDLTVAKYFTGKFTTEFLRNVDSNTQTHTFSNLCKNLHLELPRQLTSK